MIVSPTARIDGEGELICLGQHSLNDARVAALLAKLGEARVSDGGGTPQPLPALSFSAPHRHCVEVLDRVGAPAPG